MSIVDLNHRLTENYEDYYRLNKSSDSLVYVNGEVLLVDGPSSLELTVGETWYDCNDGINYEVLNNGNLTIKSGSAAVIETEQIIGLPTNIFGLVTGKGKFIFQGILVSSGKIDPGFHDHLRIGLYNGGKEPLILKRGDAFCSCCFFQLESNVDAPRRSLPLIPRKAFSSLPAARRLILFFRRDWGWILSILFALLSFIVSLYGLSAKDSHADSRRQPEIPGGTTSNRQQ
jgi:dUTPase